MRIAIYIKVPVLYIYSNSLGVFGWANLGAVLVRAG